MAKASDCGSEDRGFESLHPPHFFLSLERHWILGCRQAVRHQTLTLALAGSSPAIPATPEQSMLCPGSFYAQPLSFLLFVSIFDPLAQLAEQLPFKQWVRGSNPRRVTRKSTPKRAFSLISEDQRPFEIKGLTVCCAHALAACGLLSSARFLTRRHPAVVRQPDVSYVSVFSY